VPEPQSQLVEATKATSPNKVSLSLSQASLEWVQRELAIGTTARSSYDGTHYRLSNPDTLEARSYDMVL